MSSNSTGNMACHYMKDVVATRADQAAEVQRALDELLGNGSQDEPPDEESQYEPPDKGSQHEPPDEEPRITPDKKDSENKPLSRDELKELMGAAVEDDVLKKMMSLVAVFRTRGRDPHQLATNLRERSALREERVEVSPIHALGTLNHLAYMTGTDPERTVVKTTPEIAESSPGRIVAVIDTGVTESPPPWLASGLAFDQEADIETLGGRLGASHGTFVAGLIRLIAPEHTISIAKAGRVSINSLDPEVEDGHPEADDPTTELHVLEAMIRLVNRLGKADSCDVAAIALAMGGVCEDHDPAFTPLAAALDLWRNAFPRAPIFAAGGNTKATRPVFPGAFEYVRAVAAAAEKGGQRVWDRSSMSAQTVPAASRPWITDVAPGSELVGPSGRAESEWEWVKWSGSSFATAVATGSYASRRPNEALAGLLFWPDQNTKASDIPGLVS